MWAFEVQRLKQYLFNNVIFKTLKIFFMLVYIWWTSYILSKMTFDHYFKWLTFVIKTNFCKVLEYDINIVHSLCTTSFIQHRWAESRQKDWDDEFLYKFSCTGRIESGQTIRTLRRQSSSSSKLRSSLTSLQQELMDCSGWMNISPEQYLSLTSECKL